MQFTGLVGFWQEIGVAAVMNSEAQCDKLERRQSGAPQLQCISVYSCHIRLVATIISTVKKPPAASLLNANFFSRRVRALLLAVALGAVSAVADEYSDVSQLMRSGKTSEALAKIEQQLITRPRDPQMRFFKGLIQRDTGRQTEAIATFTELTQEYPELPEPYNNLAVLYAAQNQFERARAALEMALKNNPRYAVAYENLGDVYARLAAEAYDKALQIDATSSASILPKLKVVRELFSLTSK